MNSAMTHSFGAELARIAANLKESTVWPSPATGIALQLLKLCGCDERRMSFSAPLPFPTGRLMRPQPPLRLDSLWP